MDLNTKPYLVVDASTGLKGIFTVASPQTAMQQYVEQMTQVDQPVNPAALSASPAVIDSATGQWRAMTTAELKAASVNVDDTPVVCNIPPTPRPPVMNPKEVEPD